MLCQFHLTISRPARIQATVIPSEARDLLSAASPSPPAPATSKAVGLAGELTRRIADELKLRQTIFLAELQLDPLYAAMRAAKESRKYEPVPRFPAVERDFSLLLPDGTHFSDVAAAIRSLPIPEIASIEATDLFRGKNVPAGKYSLLVRVTFQSRESTLTDAQLTDFSSRIISALVSRLSAQLRAT